MKKLLKDITTARAELELIETEIADLSRLADQTRISDGELAEIDPKDDDAINAVARRQALFSIIPQRMGKLTGRKMELVRSLRPLSEALATELAAAKSAEQEQIVSKVAALLEPYAPTYSERNGAVVKPADRLARALPILDAIEHAATPAARFPEEGGDEARFARDALEAVQAMTAIVDRFLAAKTFVPAAFSQAAKA